MSEVNQLFEQAMEAEEAGQLENARTLFERCLAIDPNLKYIWRRYAIVLYELHLCDEAIHAALQALQDSSPKGQAWSHALIGNCYRHMKRYEEAEKSYRHSLAIEPQPYTWSLLYQALYEMDREDEAIECLKETLQLDPDYEEAHFNLGYYYRTNGQYELAEHHLRRAIEIDPKYASAYSELGWLKYFQARQFIKDGDDDNGRLSEAKTLLIKSISLDAEYGWSRIYLANVLWHQEKLQAAEKQYQAALKIWPNYSLAYWTYGDFLSSTNGDHAKAGRLLKKAVELDSEDAFAYYHLGRHLLRLKRKFKAKQAFQKAVELGHNGAQKYLDKLETG